MQEPAPSLVITTNDRYSLVIIAFRKNHQQLRAITRAFSYVLLTFPHFSLRFPTFSYFFL